MKPIICVLFFLLAGNLLAQKDCDYTSSVADSLGTYKSTNDYMVYEKNFAGKKNYIFFSLILLNGTPSLQVQIIHKSKEFIKANCFDKNSKLFFQLNNGKVVTLIHVNQESCGTLIRDNDGFDNRLLTGNFLFLKGSFEDLKSASANLVRIKYFTDTENYVLPKAFTSEMNSKSYEPENYFINFLKCIESPEQLLPKTTIKRRNK